MNCPKTLELIKESQELHTQALAQIQKFCDTFFDLRLKNDLNIFTELRKINTEYENLKKQINENLKAIEFLFPFSYEQYLTQIHPQMVETYKRWGYLQIELKTINFVVSDPQNVHIDKDIPFDTLKSINDDETKIEVNKIKIGEIYLSSEQLNFENARLFIPEIPHSFKKQGISSVMKSIHSLYKEKYILPDIKYYQYLAQLGLQYKNEKDPIKKDAILQKIPKQLIDGNYYFFPKLAFVSALGTWLSPYLQWSGTEFLQVAYRIDSIWFPQSRVVLLER